MTKKIFEKFHNWRYFLFILPIMLSYFIHRYCPDIDIITPLLLDNNSNALFWLYSTLAQSIAAIMAISAMFVVYRLTSLESELKDVFNNDKIKSSLTDFYPYASAENLIKHLEKKIKENCTQNRDNIEQTLPLAKVSRATSIPQPRSN